MSFAQDVGISSGPAFPCEDLASALRRRALPEREDPVDDSDQDDDRSSVNTDELDEDAYLDGSSKFRYMLNALYDADSCIAQLFFLRPM